MKGNNKRKPPVPPERNDSSPGGNPAEQPERAFFAGLSPKASEVIQAIGEFSLGQSGRLESPQASAGGSFMPLDNLPGSQPGQPLFSGLNVQELAKTLRPVFQTPAASPEASSTPPLAKTTRFSAIRTDAVIESLLIFKKNKGVKETPWTPT